MPLARLFLKPGIDKQNTEYGAVSWELNLYDDIAEAMKIAALEHDLPLRWGAAWNVPDIRKWDGTMAAAMNYYIDERRRLNRRPFIDAPHFEISEGI